MDYKCLLRQIFPPQIALSCGIHPQQWKATKEELDCSTVIEPTPDTLEALIPSAIWQREEEEEEKEKAEGKGEVGLSSISSVCFPLWLQSLQNGSSGFLAGNAIALVLMPGIPHLCKCLGNQVSLIIMKNSAVKFPEPGIQFRLSFR